MPEGFDGRLLAQGGRSKQSLRDMQKERENIRGRLRENARVKGAFGPGRRVVGSGKNPGSRQSDDILDFTGSASRFKNGTRAFKPLPRW